MASAPTHSTSRLCLQEQLLESAPIRKVSRLSLHLQRMASAPTHSHHLLGSTPHLLIHQKAPEMADHKVDDGLKKEIEAGKTLKDTPVPETGVNTHDATLAGITHFNKDKMNTVKTEEKVVLPSAEDIAAEKAGN